MLFRIGERPNKKNIELLDLTRKENLLMLWHEKIYFKLIINYFPRQRFTFYVKFNNFLFSLPKSLLIYIKKSILIIILSISGGKYCLIYQTFLKLISFF